MVSTVKPNTSLRVRNTFLSYVQIFILLLCPRLLSALHNVIHDTDETYNYWEPLHFLLHGTGFQTWEYSPEYAIRSWTYIALHAIPLWPVKHLLTRQTQFYMLRCILGCFSAASDGFLVHVVAAVMGKDIAAFTLIGLMTSAGMFVASTAFLPSTFVMYTSTLGLAFALRKQYYHSALCFAVGTIIGWPFSALLFMPLFLFWIYDEGRIQILKYMQIFVLSAQITLISTIYDYYRYGIWTIVPINIVLYNVFASKQGRGPELFGTEPATYYIKNLLLNFNILVLFSLVALPISIFVGQGRLHKIKASLGFLLWCTVFTAQAHKEERFIYPVYSSLVLCAAIGCSSLFRLLRPVVTMTSSILAIEPINLVRFGMVSILLASTGLSSLRIYTLVHNYSAPLQLFPSLQSGKSYCLGNDWYRFPSSFLLPQNATLSFLESDFKGLLPGKFVQSWDIPAGMNDMNQWSPDKVVDTASCDFIINWQEFPSTTHQHYFLDRETGTKRIGYYGYEPVVPEEAAARLNRLGIDLFGRKLDKDGLRYEEGELSGAIKRENIRPPP